MDNGKIIVVAVAILALIIMSYAPEITGMAYSRTLGRTETRITPAVKDCQTNEDCPDGSACRAYGAVQRIRRKARTGCVPICEDGEQNRIPFAVFDQLKSSYDISAVTGFDPQKPKPTRYRPKNSFETFVYSSNCKDTTTVVEPFCIDATTDGAAVATIEIDCGTIGDGFGCVEDDNGDASCGQPGEGDDVQRIYTATGGIEAHEETGSVSTPEETTQAPPSTLLSQKEETIPIVPIPEKQTPPPAPTPPVETNIEIRDFTFVPSTITVSAAEKITIKNTGQAVHTFSVEALGINEELKAGEEKIVVVHAQPGTYQGQCNFHASMKVTIKVT